MTPTEQHLTTTISNHVNHVLSLVGRNINDVHTRDAVKLFITVLLVTQGPTMLEDYAVICDESNNPPTVIAQNQLFVEVWFKPTGSLKGFIINGSIGAIAVNTAFADYDRAMSVVGRR